MNIEKQVEILVKDFSVSCLGKARNKPGFENCWAFIVSINGEEFEFYSGSACARKSFGRQEQGETTFCGYYVKLPTPADVLHCLFSDANIASGAFAEFCECLGYDTDSRRALETYLKCQGNGAKLRQCFTHDIYERLKNLFQGH